MKPAATLTLACAAHHEVDVSVRAVKAVDVRAHARLRVAGRVVVAL